MLTANLFGGENTITTTADGGESVLAVDVDGDGDIDVLAASSNDDTIAWFENDGNESFTPHDITTDADRVYSIFSADVDGDGDIDVLSASLNDKTIAWHENDGSQSFTPHDITTDATGARSVFAADVDGDGDIDVLSASGGDNTIAWYENDGSESFTPHDITTTADGAATVFAADVDGDGDMDVLSASISDYTIAWYENDGSESFTAHDITTAANGATSVFAADVDGDGDIDVLSSSLYDDTIAWFENFAFDFGDAPAPYPVTLAEDGARHAATGPTLGLTRDSEPDGINSAAADGDGSDEDGAVDTGETITVGQAGASVTVDIQNAPSGAKLDAWIDFNQDGDWDDAGEQIFTNTAVVNGDNALTFDVPVTAAVGTTYARLRLSTAGGLSVTGSADDGEVEDHEIEITAAEELVFDFGAGDNVIVFSDNGIGDDNIFRITSTNPTETYEYTSPSA
ncbi:MAG: FG-GAP-like repeat-containing protein, partial [Planctomycetota bacterium]|nr:FG-GAP-like repeat-containing protein [Planctomycetota bacterium]